MEKNYIIILFVLFVMGCSIIREGHYDISCEDCKTVYGRGDNVTIDVYSNWEIKFLKD